MPRIKKAIALVALTLCVTVFGTLSGSVVQSVFALPVAPCEDDKCEGGVCKDNTGRNTACVVNSSGGCDTVGCRTEAETVE
jgi:hypothetical protein